MDATICNKCKKCSVISWVRGTFWFRTETNFLFFLLYLSYFHNVLIPCFISTVWLKKKIQNNFPEQEIVTNNVFDKKCSNVFA